MKLCFADTETYSECNLKVHGSARYAEDPSTEIIIAQWALGDDEPTVWDCTEHGKPQAFIDLLLDPEVIFVWQNGVFDRQVIAACWGIALPIERCLDTMAKAQEHGLPGSLEKIGQVLGHDEDEAKDKRGRDLINLFSKPRPANMTLRRATRLTHPAEWLEFMGYSRQDVISMRAVYRDLPSWNYKAAHFELDLFHLDAKINARGVAVDTDLARAAIDAVAVETKRLKQETVDATDGLVSAPSKRDALLTFILAEYGVTLPDLKADTLRRRLEDPELPDGVKLLLSIRLEATKTSTAKYKALLNAVSADGRLRNTLQFCGAQRTGRWAGRTFQPQNMPRPDMKQGEIDLGIEALKAGTADLVFGNDTMRLTANAVRGCIVAPPGRKLCIADLSNIEGRGLAYLAGEKWKLKAFADFDASLIVDAAGKPVLDKKGERQFAKPDLYRGSYARSMGVDVNSVGKDQRQQGKVLELAMGFEGGVASFITFAVVYGMDLDELADAVHSTAPKESLAAAYGMWDWTVKKGRSTLGLPKNVWVACEVLKASWRAAHAATKQLWADAKDAVASAIQNPGVTFDIGQHLKARRDGAWLRIRLPSGRYLCYLQPKVDDAGQITYSGISQYTRQWTRIKTYGGKIVENATQAFARDVMAYAMPKIEQAGYEIVLSVHDELLTEAPDTDQYSHEALASMMATAPPWARGLPLAAAGFETARYRKD